MRARLLIAFAVSLALLRPALAQWALVPALPTREFGAVYVHDGTLYAGSADALYISTDGATWTPSASFPVDAEAVTAIVEHEGRLFVGSYDGVLESADGGASWTPRSDGLAGLGARVITGFAVRGGQLYAGTAGAGVFRLAGTTWQPFSDGLPGNVDSITAMGDLLVAGASANGYVYVNETGAPSWTAHTYMPFVPSGPHLLALAAVSDVLLGGGTHGLFRSTDQGHTWSRFDPGLGRFQHVILALHEARAYAFAIRGNRTYILVSDDAGASWQYMEFFDAFTYNVSAFNDHLYASGTDGLRVRKVDPVSREEPPSAVVSALALAPNPFRHATRVAYSLPSPAAVTLEVYDVTGRRVDVLDGGHRSAGEHAVEWTPAALPSGVYAVRLRAGHHVVTRMAVRIE